MTDFKINHLLHKKKMTFPPGNFYIELQAEKMLAAIVENGHEQGIESYDVLEVVATACSRVVLTYADWTGQDKKQLLTAFGQEIISAANREL